ncbi:hypothetical protein RJ641_003201 [Dillenia turbinata]|uniref:Uncharacterized protein n=1 Tax=Dillenia turbinata TaxID=194707 RepID=A0AAN8VPD6_9MAGN
MKNDSRISQLQATFGCQKKISNPREMFKILDYAVKEKYPILIIAEGIEQEALAPVIRNKLRGALKAAAIKAPAFGEHKSHCLDDIAILTGGTVIRDEMGLTLKKLERRYWEVLPKW